LAAKKQAELDAVKSGSERQRPKEVKNEFSNAPEVRMAVALRESVEDAIKKVKFILLLSSLMLNSA
jgi:hypothetical protein